MYLLYTYNTLLALICCGYFTIHTKPSAFNLKQQTSQPHFPASLYASTVVCYQCVICLSTGIAIISKQPDQLPQWNSSIAPVLALLMTAPCSGGGDDPGQGQGSAARLHTLSHTTWPPSTVTFIVITAATQLSVLLLMFGELSHGRKLDTSNLVVRWRKGCYWKKSAQA